MKRAHWIGLVMGFAAAWPAALAHDFWMELSRYRVEAGAMVDVSLRIGHGAEVNAYPRKAAHIGWFRVEGRDVREPVRGTVGDDPAGRVTLDEPGLYAVGYRSTPSYIELDAEAFESYLRHEGLGSIVEQRRARGESDATGREVYARCAKAFVRVGDGPAREEKYARPLGLSLEFTPMSDPSAIRRGARFGVRLTHEGRPLAGARVDAMHWASEGAEPVTLIGETDGEGEVSFEFDRPGTWVIASTHMYEAPAEHKADWESLWAALTVEVRAGE